MKHSPVAASRLLRKENNHFANIVQTGKHAGPIYPGFDELPSRSVPRRGCTSRSECTLRQTLHAAGEWLLQVEVERLGNVTAGAAKERLPACVNSGLALHSGLEGDGHL